MLLLTLQYKENRRFPPSTKSASPPAPLSPPAPPPFPPTPYPSPTPPSSPAPRPPRTYASELFQQTQAEKWGDGSHRGRKVSQWTDEAVDQLLDRSTGPAEKEAAAAAAAAAAAGGSAEDGAEGEPASNPLGSLLQTFKVCLVPFQYNLGMFCFRFSTISGVLFPFGAISGVLFPFGTIPVVLFPFGTISGRFKK